MFSPRYSSMSSGPYPSAVFDSKPGVQLLKGVGDVLEEDEAEDDVLVLGGVHAAPKGVGHPPERGLIARQSAALLGLRLRVRPSRSYCRHGDSLPRLDVERNLSTSCLGFLPSGP